MNTSVLTHSQRKAWTTYQRLRLRLTERLNRELSDKTGLSEADYEILTALLQSPDDTVRALALRCGLEWEKSRLSHQLKRMEARGLVTREECVEDNRSTVIRVTETGRKLADEAQRCYDAAIQRYVTSVLTAEQMDSLNEIAEMILTELESGEIRKHPR